LKGWERVEEILELEEECGRLGDGLGSQKRAKRWYTYFFQPKKLEK